MPNDTKSSTPKPEWWRSGTGWRLYIGGTKVAEIELGVAYQCGPWGAAGHAPHRPAIEVVAEWGLEQTPPVVVPPLPTRRRQPKESAQ